MSIPDPFSSRPNIKEEKAVWLARLGIGIGLTIDGCVLVIRDGTLQGTGVLMHHAKSITIPRYIITHEHFYDQYTQKQ